MSFVLQPHSNEDYLTLDYEGFRQSMLDKLKELLPEYTDYSETDMGVILIELLAHGLDILAYYKDRQVLESFLQTARERTNVILHCKNLGYTLKGSSPAVYTQVFKTNKLGLKIDASEHFKVRTSSEYDGSKLIYEVVGGYDTNGKFSSTFEIPSGVVGDEKVNGEYTYRAVVVQGSTIQEKAGTSDGTPSQTFRLSTSPAMSYTPTEFGETVICVYVGGKDDPKYQWNLCNNFLSSSSTSKHFTYTIDENGVGIIEFGNGTSGAIPEQGAEINVVYRVGGGAVTNVPENSITECESKKSAIVSTFNPDGPLLHGDDAESIEEAKINAPISLRTLNRAVTEKDYSDIALLLEYVLSAESKLSDTGVMDIHIMPVIDKSTNVICVAGTSVIGGSSSGVTTDYYIEIPADKKAELKAYYDERRMAGQQVAIWETHIKYVTPTVRISHSENFSTASVVANVKQELFNLMKLGNYKLGEDLVWSDLTSKLLSRVNGLLSVQFATKETVTTSSGESKDVYVLSENLKHVAGSVFAVNNINKITVTTD